MPYKLFLLIILLSSSLFFGGVERAEALAGSGDPETTEETVTLEQARFPYYDLEVPIGSKTMIIDVADYIAVVYTFVISIIGIVATVMIMFGGIGWMTAAGNQERIGKAKETIISAVIGLILGLGSYTLLSIINPALVGLQGGSIPLLRPLETGGTDATMDTCSIDNTNITGFPKEVASCPAGTSLYGTGGTMTQAEVADAINTYRGNLSPAFVGAIMYAEAVHIGNQICSNSRSNFPKDDGTVGHACGVIQVLPSTARDHDMSCGIALSNDDDTACQELISHPKEALCIGIEYLKGLAADYGTDEVKIAAGYNGGRGANAESKTCEGYLVWQCLENKEYAETRAYVSRVAGFRNNLCTEFGGTVGEIEIPSSPAPSPPEGTH